MPNLADQNICTGCTACMSICPKNCIEMQKDDNGFNFPEVTNPSACIECDACKQICPVLTERKSVTHNLPVAYAAFSNDELLRMDSSSGGIFSEIAKVIFEKQGAVYGAAYNESFEVYHQCVEDFADIHKLRGAKYSESSLENTFSEILERLKGGQDVLFAGTPCQVAGLKKFVRKDYDNLICIDFVCHGVPSPVAWKAYINFRAKEDASGQLPIAINLRAKHTGWSKYQYSNMFQYEDGITNSTVSSRSLFMKLFVGDYISRPSCETCRFKGYQRVSDITLGDFWGIWEIAPEMDDNKGTSVVLLQSEKGKLLWEEIKDKIVFKQVTLEQASQENQSMLATSKAKENRAEILNQIREGRIGECEELFVQEMPSLAERIRGKVERLIRKVLRA